MSRPEAQMVNVPVIWVEMKAPRVGATFLDNWMKDKGHSILHSMSVDTSKSYRDITKDIDDLYEAFHIHNISNAQNPRKLQNVVERLRDHNRKFQEKFKRDEFVKHFTPVEEKPDTTKPEQSNTQNSTPSAQQSNPYGDYKPPKWAADNTSSTPTKEAPPPPYSPYAYTQLPPQAYSQPPPPPSHPPPPYYPPSNAPPPEQPQQPYYPQPSHPPPEQPQQPYYPHV